MGLVASPMALHFGPVSCQQLEQSAGFGLQGHVRIAPALHDSDHLAGAESAALCKALQTLRVIPVLCLPKAFSGLLSLDL